jgi:L-lysine 6-transaminase
VGEHLRRGLEALERELSPLITNARGRGLMIALDLPTPAIRDKAHERMVENGLLLLKSGVRSLRFRPALNLSAADADRGLEIVRKSLKEQ